jgi:dTDP-4-amino-4,6-dideoxygalactose transaminase
MKKKSILVTKSFMPPIHEYEKYIKTIYETGVLTNQGPLVLELEEKMRSFLDVENFHFVTIAYLLLV